MAEQKPASKQTKGAKLEVPEESPLRPPEKKETPSKAPVEFKRERSGLAQEVTREKSEMVQRDRFRKLLEAKEFDQNTLADLKRLDVTKRASEQPRTFTTFLAASSVLLTRWFYQNRAATDVTPENFAEVLKQTKLLPVSEHSYLEILNRLRNPQALLKEDVLAAWPEVLTLAHEAASHIPGIQAMEQTRWETPLQPKQRNGVLGYLQEHPALRKTLIAAGVLGGLALLGRWFFRRKKKEGEGGGWGSKILKTAAVAGIAAFSFGYTRRHYRDWISWVKSWFEEQKTPSFEKLANRIKISPDILERLGKESFSTFMKGNLEGDKGWGWVPTQAAQFLGMGGMPTGFGKKKFGFIPIPYTGISLAEANQVRNFLKEAAEKPEVKAALKKYNIDLNDEKVNLATVFAVLNEMEHNGSLEKAIATTGENPENDPDNDVAVETDKETAVVVASKTFEELKEFAKFEAPHVRAVLEKWEKIGYAKIIWNMGDFAKDLVQAAEKEEKTALLISGSKIVLWNGLKYVVVASGATLVETFKKAAEAIMFDKVTAPDVLKTYMDRTVEFVVIGGAVGLIRGVKASGKFGLIPTGVLSGGIPGAIRGGIKGFLFPFHVAYKTSRAGALIFHEAKETKWRFKRFFTGAEAHAQYWGEQARMEADVYRRWYQWREYRMGGMRHPVKSVIAQHLIPEDIEAYCHRYGSRFSNSYNRFAEAYNKAFASEIAAGTRRALTELKFDPRIDGRMEALAKLIDEEFPKTSRGTTRAATTFEEALEAEKLRIDPKKTRLARYWTKLAKVLSPVAAAYNIYHLETAQDKKKAVAETALGYGGFLTGVTMTERTFGKAIKHPGWHAFAVTLGGIAGALGLTGGIDDLVNDYFLTFPGAYKASEEVAHMLELASGGYLAKKVVQAGKTEIATKAAERVGMKGGMKALEEVMMKRLLESGIVKKLEALAAKGIFKKIAAKLAVKLGARGAVLVAGHAIPGVNVLALAIDVALLPFFAKDIYDVVMAAKNASKLDEVMRERRTHAFLAVEILEPPDAKSQFEKNKDALMKQGEGAIIGFFDQFPHLKARITRQDVKGDEIWTFKKGVVEGLAIRDDQGKEVVAMESKDMERLGEKTFPEEAKVKPQLAPQQASA